MKWVFLEMLVTVTAADFWVVSLYDFPFYCNFPKGISSVNVFLLQLIANLHTYAREEVDIFCSSCNLRLFVRIFFSW